MRAAHADGATATMVPQRRMQEVMGDNLPEQILVDTARLQCLDQACARLMTTTLASARFCESVAVQFAAERDSVAMVQDALRGIAMEAVGVDFAEMAAAAEE